MWCEAIKSHQVTLQPGIVSICVRAGGGGGGGGNENFLSVIKMMIIKASFGVLMMMMLSWLAPLQSLSELCGCEAVACPLHHYDSTQYSLHSAHRRGKQSFSGDAEDSSSCVARQPANVFLISFQHELFALYLTNHCCPVM